MLIRWVLLENTSPKTSCVHLSPGITDVKVIMNILMLLKENQSSCIFIWTELWTQHLTRAAHFEGYKLWILQGEIVTMCHPHSEQPESHTELSYPSSNQTVRWSQTVWAVEQPAAGPNDPEPSVVKWMACNAQEEEAQSIISLLLCETNPLLLSIPPSSSSSVAGMCPWNMCNFPLKLGGPEPWKAPQVLGCMVRSSNGGSPRYMPGLYVVKLWWQKDTRALVCNILKPREINYPSALMNYELCLRSSQCFITWKSSLEYGEHHLIFLPPYGLLRFVGNNCIFY